MTTLNNECDLAKYAAEIKNYTLSQLAKEIRIRWPKVNYAAKPYLDAMASLTSIHDNYFSDSAQTVVVYFLSNASGWRGDIAKLIKAELKERANIK